MFRPLRWFGLQTAILLGFCTFSPTQAAPVWSRIDTGLGAAVASNGQIAQANAVRDSVWIRVLNPDGAIRWTAHWDLNTTRRLWVKNLVPTADAGWILAMDTANGIGSWMVRLDSLGRQVGSPMGMRHDTCLSLFVVDAAGETWAVLDAMNESATRLYRFGSDGQFKDSTRIDHPGTLQEIRFISGKLVTRSTQSSEHLETFQLYGLSTRSAKDSFEFLDSDSLLESYYSMVWRDGSGLAGVGGMVFATDSGKLDYAKGLVPRVRVVSWAIRGDSLVRQIDATNDLAYFNAFWAGNDGNLIVVGSRRTTASAGGIIKFEPAVVQLDDNFRQVRAWAVHPNGLPTTDLASVFAGSFPDGSGYVGVHGYNSNPTSITILDRNGDSTNTVTLATIYSAVNIWYGQPGGRLLNLGQPYDGGTRSIESWSTTGNTSMRDRRRTYSSLQAVGGRLVLELDHAVAFAHIDRVDLHGRIRESLTLGALAAGRHVWDFGDRSIGLVRVRMDDEILVAKVPMRMR